MLMLTVWNGTMEREGRTRFSLSSFCGSSTAAACMAKSSEATKHGPKPMVRLSPAGVHRAQELHRQGLGLHAIGLRLGVTPWQVRGALGKVKGAK